VSAAGEAGVRIEWVLDTHGHNDYLSGLGALVALGATAIAPIGATVGYDAVPSHDGFELTLGPNASVELLHVPGHTPEHTAVLVRDGAGAALLSGGSLLAGDVGRPDLLGSAAQVGHAAGALRRAILDLVERRDDELVVLPTHVGGSLCAGGIGDELESTIGRERTTSPAIAAMVAAGDELPWLDPDSLPPVPAFWPTTRAANLAGVPPVERRRPVQQRADELAPDDLLLDVRDLDDPGDAVAGAIEVPLSGSFTVWAGIMAHGHARVVVVAEDAEQAAAAHARLLDVRVTGADAWVDAVELARAPESARSIDDDRVREDVARGERVLIDVRNPGEVADRPIRGAVVLPAAELLRDPAVAPSGRLALACASGYRARIVASALRADGFDAQAIDGAVTEPLVPASALG
jgi:hydroxyacylglutathione hydrolase